MAITLGQMGRASKDKRDIYYRKAKEEGFRARSAYKLLQIDESFPLFENISNGVVDLCAAPGSWCQVISRLLREKQDAQNADLLGQLQAVDSEQANKMAATPSSLPPPPPVVGVDLQEMAPIDGVTLLQGDITSEVTAKEIIRLLTEAAERRNQSLAKLKSMLPSNGEGEGNASSSSSSSMSRLADIVVCDGAPDVTGLHELDEYLQHQLLLAALHITSHVLRPGGTFVTKMFRGPNTSFLLAKSEVFFKSVRLIKPMSSRNASMECFMLCENFELPSGYIPCFPSSSMENSGMENVKESEEADRQRRRTEGMDERVGASLNTGNHLVSQAPHCTTSQNANDRGQHIFSFLACGDLSGYDADMCYAASSSTTSPGQKSLLPVQPPLQAPYLATHASH